MGRSDPHRSTHVREEKPAAPPAPPPDPKAAAPEPEARRRPGWGVAILIWAVATLFLAALMVFDMIAGLFRK
jgi:hypothetical protein